jgi:hypothetical protein
MRTYKKKRIYTKTLNRTHKKRKKRTKKRKTKRNIRGGKAVPQELELMANKSYPDIETTTSNNPQMMTNPQMITNPQMMPSPQMMTNPQMPITPPTDGRVIQSANIPLPPQDGISNRNPGLFGEMRDNFMKNQQNKNLNLTSGILSHEELMNYLEVFKNQIKEIININPDEDRIRFKDMSDIQAKKILEALSSHRAKIGGLQHTLYRQNRKFKNEIDSEKRRLEAKFSNLEKKIVNEIKKLKRERSPRRSTNEQPFNRERSPRS